MGKSSKFLPIKSIRDLKLETRWRAFRLWRRKPHQVAPLKDEVHTCATCGTSFQGNYCPRCGQSARVGRYSFKQTFLLFLDVWGLGNRGMFRSMRDLILRPGFMIRDYLQGMQMAYFPPFKMFFLLATFSLLVSSGFNIAGKNTLKEEQQAKAQIEQAQTQIFNTWQQEDTVNAVTPADSTNAMASTDSIATPGSNDELSSLNPEQLKASQRLQDALKAVGSFIDSYPTIFSLLGLVILSGPLFLFFRRSPAYPGLRFSEFLVAIVYTANMASIYSIIIDFFKLGGIFEAAALLSTLVPLHQFSGFKYRKVILYSFLACALLLVVIVLLIIATTVVSLAWMN